MSRMQVLIVGGGVAALEAAVALHELGAERVDVELVAPGQDFVHRPFAVAEPFRSGEVRRFGLARLAAGAGATLRHGRVASIEPGRGHAVTAAGATLSFDAVLVAAGARPVAAVPGALTFRGPEDERAIAELLEAADTGRVRRVVFALPAAATWVLPLYELALLTAAHVHDAGEEVEIAIVTPEERPLELFGLQASEAVGELLDVRGIRVVTGTAPIALASGRLRTVSGASIEADAVVATPRLEGARIDGLPYDADGFVRTDEHARVDELSAVYAAGDITAFLVKQGGIAAQQADAAAQSIASLAGAGIEPAPFRPVLRGVLLTGVFARYLYAEPGTQVSKLDTVALWWPPAKIAGRYLAPFLASQMGLDAAPAPPDAAGSVLVDRALAQPRVPIHS